MEMEMVHIVEAKAEHTHTVILLHGRGSSGPEFAEELAEGLTSSGLSLFDAFPGFRWVFPTAPLRWSTVFQEEMREWFDTPSLCDISLQEELQIPGLRSSLEFVQGVVDAQVAHLGSSTKVVLGGISQGQATALHVLLRTKHKLGGFVGASGWLPLADGIHEVVLGHETSCGVASAVCSYLARRFELPADGGCECRTPVFLGHGSDDEVVDVRLGRQAWDVLCRMDMNVTWKEYVGAEADGHWLKEPEEFYDIATFLDRVIHGEDFHNQEGSESHKDSNNSEVVETIS